MPHRDVPPRLSGQDKASFSRGSDLRGAHPAGRPTAPGSPAAGSLRTAERNVQLVSANRSEGFSFLNPRGAATGAAQSRTNAHKNYFFFQF